MFRIIPRSRYGVFTYLLPAGMDGLPFGPYSEVDMVCSNTHRRADWIVALGGQALERHLLWHRRFRPE
jgi:hypothetical protein